MPTFLNRKEKEDAQRRVSEAIACCWTAGTGATLAEMMNPVGHFVRDRDYLFAMDFNGCMLAHPMNHDFVGKNLLDIKDSEGRSFVREVIELAGRAGRGFVDYMWHDPISGEELLKTIYFEGTDGMIICGGFYSPKEHYPENYFELLEYLGVLQPADEQKISGEKR